MFSIVFKMDYSVSPFIGLEKRYLDSMFFSKCFAQFHLLLHCLLRTSVPGECSCHSMSDTQDLANSFISPHRHNSKVHTQNITSNLMNVGVVRLHGIYDILLHRLYINAKESICQSLSLSSLLFMKSLQYRKPNVSLIILGVSWAMVTAGAACLSEPTQ